MHAMFWRHAKMTTGESRLVLAYVTVSLFGAVLAFCAAMRLAHGASMIGSLRPYDIWMCCAGAIGAGVALYLTRHRLGQPGLPGLWQAIIGMGLISFAGSLIAGTLALPLYGTMFGPFTLAVILIGSPMLAALWASNLLGVHVLMCQWRVERDSIFTANDQMKVRTARPAVAIPRP